MHCAKFGWNWPSGSGEEDENVKRDENDGQRTSFDQKNKRALTYYINMQWFAKKRDKYIYYLVAFFPCENISHIHGLCYSMMETAYIQTLALGPLSM